MAAMQITAEQGSFMGLLVKLVGAKRILEIGTFTGYSALSMARALPADGTLIASDVSEEWTAIAREFWKKANVADRITLILKPGRDVIADLLAKDEAGSMRCSSMPTSTITITITKAASSCCAPVAS